MSANNRVTPRSTKAEIWAALQEQIKINGDLRVTLSHRDHTVQALTHELEMVRSFRPKTPKPSELTSPFKTLAEKAKLLATKHRITVKIENGHVLVKTTDGWKIVD